MVKKKKEISEQRIPVPIEWHISDNIVTRFASNIVVQVIENEFKISFFELNPDIHLTPIEPPSDKVKADCVASVIVTPDRLPKFIEVLQRQLDLYNSRIKPQE